MLGFNQEVYHLNHELHVQTEASPYEDRFQLMTHLFYKGMILATEKQIVLTNSEEELQKEVDQQHISFVKKIIQGKFNQEIELKAPSMSAQAAVVQYETNQQLAQAHAWKQSKHQMQALSLDHQKLDNQKLDNLKEAEAFTVSVTPFFEQGGLHQSFIKYLIKQSKI
jgi:hypothetical protein